MSSDSGDGVIVVRGDSVSYSSDSGEGVIVVRE